MTCSGLVLVLIGGCGESPESRFLGSVPGFPVELLAPLLGSDEDLRAFSEKSGLIPLEDGFYSLDRLTASDSSATGELEVRARPFLERLGTFIADEYEYPHYRLHLEEHRSIAFDALRKRHRDRAEMRQLWYEPNQSEHEKAQIAKRIANDARERGDSLTLVFAEGTAMALSGLRDEVDRGPRVYLDRAKRLGMIATVSQELGTTSLVLWKRGERDSAYAYLREARAIAMRSRIPYQAARTYQFEGGFLRKQGRLASAELFYEEAERVCRDLKGGSHEVVFLAQRLDFLAEIEAWKSFDRLVPRARVILRDLVASPRGNSREHERRFDCLVARRQLADDSPVAKEGIFQLIRETEGLHDPNSPSLALAAARAFLRTRQFDDAILAADEAISISREHFSDDLVYDFLPDALLVRAEAKVGRGDDASAAHDLQEFRERESQDATIPHSFRFARVEARLALRAGERVNAIRNAETALKVIAQRSEEFEVNEATYFMFESARGLRDVLHELAGEDPARSLALERSWRRYVHLLGPARSEWARRNRESALGGISAALHGPVTARQWKPAETSLTYAVLEDRIVRWVEDEESVVRHHVSLSTEESVRMIDEVVAWISRGEEAGPATAPREALEGLAAHLLPPIRAHSGEAPVLRVMLDSSLEGLPFDALDLDPGPKYKPLLTEWDVVYLRFESDNAPLKTGRPVILVNPELPSSIARRFPFLSPLPETAGEVEGLLAREPNCLRLEGAGATKNALVEAWEDAPFVWIAAHGVRDAETGLRSFVPLAASPDSRAGHPELLESADIRAVDLSGCGLVVLSSCSSGQAMSVGRGVAPSLGDYFLDAGAAAVVQTLSDVTDEDAAATMRRFADLWSEGHDPVAALGSAKRAIYGRNSRRGMTPAFSFLIEINRF